MPLKSTGDKPQNHQENTDRSHSPGQLSHTQYDFTHRPPGYGGNASSRLTELRRLGGVRSDTSTPLPQERDRVNTSSVPEVSPTFHFTDIPINQQNIQDSYNPPSTSLSPSEQILLSSEINTYQQYRQISFQELLESNDTSSIIAAFSSRSYETGERDGLSRNVENRQEINECPLSVEDHQFLENTPIYPIRNLTTGVITAFNRGGGGPLRSSYAVCDTQDPTGKASLYFIDNSSDPSSLYPADRYAIFRQNPAPYDAYQLLSPLEALQYFREREKQTQGIAQAQQLSSQISSLDISPTSLTPMQDIQDINERQQAEFNLLHRQEASDTLSSSRLHSDSRDEEPRSNTAEAQDTESKPLKKKQVQFASNLQVIKILGSGNPLFSQKPTQDRSLSPRELPIRRASPELPQQIAGLSRIPVSGRRM